MFFTDIRHRDSMAFDTGIHFITMLTGLIRVAAFLADGTGFGRENQLVLVLTKNISLDRLDDFDVFATGRQHFIHIENITDLRDGAENKGLIIAQAPLFTFFQGPDCRGTGPGVAVLGAFQLADGSYRLIKIDFGRIKKGILKNGILGYFLFNICSCHYLPLNFL